MPNTSLLPKIARRNPGRGTRWRKEKDKGKRIKSGSGSVSVSGSKRRSEWRLATTRNWTCIVQLSSTLAGRKRGYMFTRNRANTERKKSPPIPIPTPKEAVTANHRRKATEYRASVPPCVPGMARYGWGASQRVRRSVDDNVCDEESLLFGCPLSSLRCQVSGFRKNHTMLRHPET